MRASNEAEYFNSVFDYARRVAAIYCLDYVECSMSWYINHIDESQTFFVRRFLFSDC